MHATLTFKCTPTESLNKGIQKNRVEVRLSASCSSWMYMQQYLRSVFITQQ